MSFLNRLKYGFMRFMQGRYGSDKLGLATIWAALIISLIGSFAGAPFLSLVSTALWVWAIYRLFSRNLVRRRAENDWFLKQTAKIKTPVRQAVTRFKNRKVYCYFSCPKCHMHLRLPRGVGKVTVRCSKCGHSFEKKA